MYYQNKIKGILLGLLLVFAAGTVDAQVKTLTLDEAIKIALENNADRKIAELDVETANAAVKEAYGYAMPSVDLSASLNHFFEKPQVPFIDFNAMLNNATYGVLFKEGVVAEDPNKMLPMETTMMSMSQTNNISAEVQVSQILFNAAVINGIGSAQVYFDMSKYLHEQKAAETAYQVTKAFYGCVLAKEMFDIADASLKNFERNFQSVQALYDNGFASEYDKLTAEVQLENFKPTVNQALSGKTQALNGLKVIIGMSPTEEIDVAGELKYNKQNLSENKLITEAMANNYDIGTLKYKQKIDDAFVELAEADYWPTLAAFGSFSYNGSSDDWDMMSYNQALAGVSFSMNLFKGMQTTNQVQQKKVERMKTDETLRMARDGIAMQIRNKMVDIELIESNIKAAERNVDLAKKGYEIADLRYKEGNGTQVELMNAELQLRNAKTNILSYYYQYISAVEDINYWTGKVDGKYIDKYSRSNFKIKK
jgi:outer membrane protein TolC